MGTVAGNPFPLTPERWTMRMDMASHMTTTRRLLIALGVLVASAGISLTQTSPAHAEECRTVAGVRLCGRVVNLSAQRIMISDAWCFRQAPNGDHPCSRQYKDWYTNEHLRWLKPRTVSTRHFTDTDAFMIDHHCTAKWMALPGAPIQTIETGSHEKWVRIRSGQTATVLAVSCRR
ncbi:hypothetical protein [Nonomuraea sp. B5E05]|uniref:hypothetical protein n=1 Tax=Nonomuraea sp. B5E05 TaxID=3153569 RepID=UPI00326195BA